MHQRADGVCPYFDGLQDDSTSDSVPVDDSKQVLLEGKLLRLVENRNGLRLLRQNAYPSSGATFTSVGVTVGCGSGRYACQQRNFHSSIWSSQSCRIRAFSSMSASRFPSFPLHAAFGSPNMMSPKPGPSAAGPSCRSAVPETVADSRAGASEERPVLEMGWEQVCVLPLTVR